MEYNGLSDGVHLNAVQAFCFLLSHLSTLN